MQPLYSTCVTIRLAEQTEAECSLPVPGDEREEDLSVFLRLPKQWVTRKRLRLRPYEKDYYVVKYKVRMRVCILTIPLIQKLQASHYLARKCSCQNSHPASQPVYHLVQFRRHYQTGYKTGFIYHEGKAYDTICSQ